jgi:hypothetical protein
VQQVAALLSTSAVVAWRGQFPGDTSSVAGPLTSGATELVASNLAFSVWCGGMVALVALFLPTGPPGQRGGVGPRGAVQALLMSDVHTVCGYDLDDLCNQGSCKTTVCVLPRY